MGKCSVCGNSCLGEVCWKHKNYGPIKRVSGSAGLSTKKEEADKQFAFFLSLWDEREEDVDGKKFINCYESGKYLSRGVYRGLTTCYHHVLEKKSYPTLKFCKENIIILHPDLHEQSHRDITKTPKVEALREELLKKYLNGEI